MNSFSLGSLILLITYFGKFVECVSRFFNVVRMQFLSAQLEGLAENCPSKLLGVNI